MHDGGQGAHGSDADGQPTNVNHKDHQHHLHHHHHHHHHDKRHVSFGSTKRIPDVLYDLDGRRVNSEIFYVDAVAKAMKRRQLEIDPVTPYWEVELLKGPAHLKKHEYEFRQYKMRQRRVFDFLRRKSSVYITSGGDDMSLRSFATVYHGKEPPKVSPALSLFDRVDKVLVLPKEIIEDAILPCNSTVRRFFVLVNGHGHNLFRVEEEVGPRFSKPNLTILDFFAGLKLGTMKRQGSSTKYRERIEVFCPSETLLGSIEHSWKRHPTFLVMDKAGSILFTIELVKPLWFPKCAKVTELNFVVRSPDGTNKGSIRSDWDDLTYILYLSHFLYGISLPRRMEAEQKLLLSAATLMVYYAYFGGKILKQTVHIPKNSAKEFIEYQVLCGTEPDICNEGASTITSSSEIEIPRPIVDLD